MVQGFIQKGGGEGFYQEGAGGGHLPLPPLEIKMEMVM